MKNKVHTRARRSGRVRISQIAFDKFHLVAKVRQILQLPCLKVIQAAHGVSTPHQGLGNRRSNKSGAAGNKKK